MGKGKGRANKDKEGKEGRNNDISHYLQEIITNPGLKLYRELNDTKDMHPVAKTSLPVPNLYAVIEAYPLRYHKRFFPEGPKVWISDFQRSFGANRGKIWKALDLMRKYGLANKVWLGDELLLTGGLLSRRLYDRSIHPLFFTAAVFPIGHLAAELEQTAACIQLNSLRRASLKHAFKLGTVKPEEIGRDFSVFAGKTEGERLDILARLGVIRPKRIIVEPVKHTPAPELRPTIHQGQYLLRGIG